MMPHQEEIQEKKARIRRLMEQQQLDGILFRRQCNFSWLTGGGLSSVVTASDTGMASLLITSNKDYVLCNAIEAPRIEQEEQLPEQGYELRPFPWYKDREQQLVKELTNDGRVGCDCLFLGTEEISEKLNPLRYSLTSWEVERYKDVGYLTSKAIEDTASTVQPGEKECEIVGRLAEHLWANRLDYVTIFCAADGRISNFRHPVTTEKKIEKRAMLCVNARKWGLIISLTRFVQFGPVPEDLKKKYEANMYIDNVLMANTIPGKPAIEAFKKGIDAYAETGYAEEYHLHHQGGAIGYVGRDYKVTFNTTEIVRENQGFAWNPSITGSKSEDTMLATSEGPVLLSKPVSFPTVTMEVGGYAFTRPAILEK